MEKNGEECFFIIINLYRIKIHEIWWIIYRIFIVNDFKEQEEKWTQTHSDWEKKKSKPFFVDEKQ